MNRLLKIDPSNAKLLAENLKNYLKKGDKILVKGKLKNSYFVSKNGLNQKLTYILAKEIIFL